MKQVKNQKSLESVKDNLFGQATNFQKSSITGGAVIANEYWTNVDGLRFKVLDKVNG